MSLKEQKVKMFEHNSGAVRVRADSLRATVIVDIRESDFTKKQTVVLPKSVIQDIATGLQEVAAAVEAGTL